MNPRAANDHPVQEGGWDGAVGRIKAEQRNNRHVQFLSLISSKISLDQLFPRSENKEDFCKR